MKPELYGLTFFSNNIPSNKMAEPIKFICEIGEDTPPRIFPDLAEFCGLVAIFNSTASDREFQRRWVQYMVLNTRLEPLLKKGGFTSNLIKSDYTPLGAFGYIAIRHPQFDEQILMTIHAPTD